MARDIQINLNKLLQNTPFDTKNIVVGVALSGGRDSVALAHALKAADVKIVAINVEHGIRGESSVRDSEFVKHFCDTYDIPLFAYQVNAVEFSNENGYTIEQGARILRYEIFNKVLDEGKCDVIALAHHLDDQVETLLMRMLRGTGARGLVGMREVSGKFIRPLLQYTRDDVNAYVEKNCLDYVDDETNEDTTYTRNFLRAEIENLKKRFPSLCESVARLSRNMAEENDFLDSLVDDVNVVDGEARVPLSTLKNSVLGKRAIIKAVNALGVYQDVEDRHFAILFDLAKNENGKRVYLTHGLCAHKESNCIVFEIVDDSVDDSFEMPFTIGKHFDLGIAIERINLAQYESEIDKKDEKTLYIDIDKLPKDSVIRHRRNGDVISKFGGGHKSVGDYLTDKKIAKRNRDSLFVIASGSEVYAICGVEISRLAKIDEDSKNIAKIFIL